MIHTKQNLAFHSVTYAFNFKFLLPIPQKPLYVYKCIWYEYAPLCHTVECADSPLVGLGESGVRSDKEG